MSNEKRIPSAIKALCDVALGIKATPKYRDVDFRKVQEEFLKDYSEEAKVQIRKGVIDALSEEHRRRKLEAEVTTPSTPTTRKPEPRSLSEFMRRRGWGEK